MSQRAGGPSDDQVVAGIERRDEAVVVRLAGELDLYTVARARDALLSAAAERPERLVVDLGAVEFVDSTALGMLVEVRARLDDRRRLLLAAPGLETRRALQISGLDAHLHVHDTVESAIAAPLE